MSPLLCDLLPASEERMVKNQHEELIKSSGGVHTSSEVVYHVHRTHVCRVGIGSELGLLAGRGSSEKGMAALCEYISEYHTHMPMRRLPYQLPCDLDSAQRGA